MEKPNITWRVFCMYMLILILILWAGIANAQIQVMQFNAEWNKANEVDWIQDLDDCKTIAYTDIAKNPKLAKFKNISDFDKVAVFDWMKSKNETGGSANTVITFVKFLNDKKKTLADLDGKDIVDFGRNYLIRKDVKTNKFKSIQDAADAERWSVISKFLQRVRDEGFIRKYDTDW